MLLTINKCLCWCRSCCCDTIVLSGDHPFECEFCGSCFRDDGTLRGHKRIHTGEKPYECNGCGKRFSLKHQLETHYRVHTGELREESTLKIRANYSYKCCKKNWHEKRQLRVLFIIWECHFIFNCKRMQSQWKFLILIHLANVFHSHVY